MSYENEIFLRVCAFWILIFFTVPLFKWVRFLIWRKRTGYSKREVRCPTRSDRIFVKKKESDRVWLIGDQIPKRRLKEDLKSVLFPALLVFFALNLFMAILSQSELSMVTNWTYYEQIDILGEIKGVRELESWCLINTFFAFVISMILAEIHSNYLYDLYGDTHGDEELFMLIEAIADGDIGEWYYRKKALTGIKRLDVVTFSEKVYLFSVVDPDWYTVWDNIEHESWPI